MAKMTYIPWSDGITGTTRQDKIEEIFKKSDAKYILRRAFIDRGTCDQCDDDLTETDGWHSIATDSPEDIREFFKRDAWEVWEDFFASGWGDMDAVDFLTDEQKIAIVDTIVADGCNEETLRESVGDYAWTDELTYTDSDGNTYYFCCPSCAEAYQSAHPGVQLHKVG